MQLLGVLILLGILVLLLWPESTWAAHRRRAISQLRRSMTCIAPGVSGMWWMLMSIFERRFRAESTKNMLAGTKAINTTGVQEELLLKRNERSDARSYDIIP